MIFKQRPNHEQHIFLTRVTSQNVWVSPCRRDSGTGNCPQVQPSQCECNCYTLAHSASELSQVVTESNFDFFSITEALNIRRYFLFSKLFSSFVFLLSFLYHSVQTRSEAHPAFYPMGTGGSFPGNNAQGREADHSPPSGV
jgi:hypothetical protein